MHVVANIRCRKMGAKKWFRNQFRAAHLVLRHDDASEFYLSCWQKNRSPLPLICVRLVLFLACVGTLAFSFTIVGRRDLLAYWAIYFTQWGLVMNFLTTGLAIAVSLVAYFRGPIGKSNSYLCLIYSFTLMYNLF